MLLGVGFEFYPTITRYTTGLLQIDKIFAAENGPLVVNSSTRVFVMEYEAWFNPLFNPQLFSTAAYRPLLRSSNVSDGYDSSDPMIISQHLTWLTDLGVGAVIAEQTNGGPCDFGDAQMCAEFLGSPEHVADYTAVIHAINQGTINLYPAFSARATSIKLIPMADGQDALMYESRSDGQIPFDIQVGKFYESVVRYPNLNVVYQGKPLLLVYLGAAQNPGDPNSILNKALTAVEGWQDRFTIRLMAGFIDSQPYLWRTPSGIAGLHETNPQYRLWTWIDRLNPSHNLLPSYAVDGNRVEAFTITNAAVSTDANALWNGADTTLYRNGATFTDFLNYARTLDPIFLIVNQFNEFSGPPDQGGDIEHSNDIEPTQQWGYDKFNVVKQKLREYRGVFASPPQVTINSIPSILIGQTLGTVMGTATDAIGVENVKVVIRYKPGAGETCTTDSRDWNGTAWVAGCETARQITPVITPGTSVTWSVANTPPLAQMNPGTYRIFAAAFRSEAPLVMSPWATADTTYQAAANPAPTISTFTASPALITTGGSSVLSWTASNATSLSIDNGVGIVSGTSVSVHPAQTTTYTLTATGSGGTATRSVTVTISQGTPPPPPSPTDPRIETFGATPTTIQRGASAQLSWRVTAAVSCAASGGWSGARPLSGTGNRPPRRYCALHTHL